ncbi:acyl-CoA dehydrogenase family protein [Oceanobacillus senegalensis]|uniref:acyl-CoA dehydrogenase family protein n=1 Tax=Oceanobacillus senegalensis TaxID=1936063 RepID=UPI0015C44E35|nr:acyl-CoA dehydrogenase family protein [Oceanobacillus senegalensis]
MHELIMDSTTKIFKDICTKELVDQAEKGSWAEELWNVLVDSGITSVGVPESIGGTGGDYVDAFHILRLAGEFAVPLPLSETLIVNWLLAEQGVGPQKEPLTFGLDLNSKFKLEKENDGLIVNGSINNVPWARNASKVLVLGELDSHSVLMLLPLDQATFIYEKSNLAGEPRDTVVFNHTIIKDLETYVIEEKELMEKALELGGLSKAAMMSGAINRVLDLSVQYVKEREQFGRPLHRLQAIQQHIAVLSGEAVASLTITNKAIDIYDKELNVNEIADAKLKVNESAGIITEISHQIHGAIGATHEHQLHQLTRRLWAWRDEFGNENFWAERLAENVIHSNVDTLWEMITDHKVKETIK